MHPAVQPCAVQVYATSSLSAGEDLIASRACVWVHRTCKQLQAQGHFSVKAQRSMHFCDGNAQHACTKTKTSMLVLPLIMTVSSAFVTSVLECSSQTWDKGFRAPWIMCCTPPTPWCQQQHWSCRMNLTSRTRATPKQGCQMRHGPLTTLLCWQSSSTSRLELGQLLLLRLKNGSHMLV